VLSLRTTAHPADAAAFLRQIVAELDARQFVTNRDGRRDLQNRDREPRFIAWLLAAFAGLALLLAAAGLYSVASCLIAQRRRDIGFHIAVGAAPRDVARRVIGEAGRWIAIGPLVGCALGWMGTRALQSQLYDVQPLDPWSWTGAVIALALALIVAAARPASRTAHVDPIAALRAE
jgi:putative ABC transport system permease protein